MPVLHAHNISYKFDNGETLFKGISCSLQVNKTGLIGRNGAGKSILASILAGELKPTKGSVSIQGQCARYSQLPSDLRERGISIADFLGVSEILYAIKQVESGSCDPKWFDIIGEHWSLEARLSEQLQMLGVTRNLRLPCKALSGGELSRLQLWSLFQKSPEILILDEPSNHLDRNGKDWLIEQIHSYQGKLLLISHDKELLRQMQHIWEISDLGLTQYGGNFDYFSIQKQLQISSVEKQLKSLNQQQIQLDRQAQKNREKADKRQSQGNKIRARGGQPKILLNSMRSGAESAAQNRVKNESHRRFMLDQQKQELTQRHETLKAQSLHIDSDKPASKRLVRFSQARLPFGCADTFDLTITSITKLNLLGDNGSGKSTLLKVLLGKLELSAGKLILNGPTCYLDQHFSLLDKEANLLKNLTTQCIGLQEIDARTLLAGIGFRGESVFRRVSQLSGGERMKLAVLIVSHQKEQPLLLLDEPDNHLDLESKQVLAEALKAYKGAFIIVSHDKEFTAQLGINEFITLSKP